MNAQTLMDETPDYSWADGTHSKNNYELYQGVRFNDSYRIINKKHRYLDRFDFFEGGLLFKGDYYNHLQLKFDLHEQQLLVLHPDSDGITTIAIDMNNIDAFRVGDRKFEKKQLLEQSLFLQYLGQYNGIEIWEQHSKKIGYRQNSKITYYEFIPKNSFWVYNGTQWRNLKKKLDLKPFFITEINLLKEAEIKWRDLIKTDGETYLLNCLNLLNQNR